ncbi:hypothetical protein MNBD_GAMMA03-1930 [hydrothermal vent metagenome]|uniref:Lysophospholipid acyltransferase n=1 Tax=hydrothermal vent metagenome TaxID=652676 RepID=A0A3B0WYT9_9ZZZZ
MEKDWQQEKEMSNIFWLKLIIRLALKLPRWSIRLLLYPIVLFFFLTSGHKRKASYHYLTQALPHRPQVWHVYKHFYWFAATLVDHVYFLSGQTRLFDISFINREVVVNSLEKNPSQFLLSGHYGSIHALRTQLSDKKYQIRPVVKLEHNQNIVTLFNQLNPDFYKDIIPYDGLNTIFEIYENLKNNVSIALLADRPIGDGKTLSVQFLNDTIQLPKSLFEMLLRLPFSANLFFSKYLGKNSYQIEYFSFSIASNDTPQTLAQKFADKLAKQCLESPYNWFNFYVYWDSKDHV